MRGPHSTRFSLVATFVKMASAVMRLQRPKPQSIFPIRDRTRGNFTQIDNRILCRKDLSFRAKGVLLYLLSRPPQWKVVLNDIVKRGRDGREAIRASARELEKMGFIRRTPGTHQRDGDTWEVFEDPTEANRLPRNPESSGARKIHRIEERTEAFTQISNSILQNTRLHFRSKGILAYLLSKPTTWLVSMKDVEDHGTEGREKVRSSFSELSEAGYLTRRRARNTRTGRLSGWENLIYEDPSEAIVEKPTDGSPNDGNPNDGMPTDGKPSPRKKDCRKKEKRKKPPIPPPGGIFSLESPGKENSLGPTSAGKSGANPSSSPGIEQDQQAGAKAKSSALPSRILDYPSDRPITGAVAMQLVQTDPLAREFHDLFPNPAWTEGLARKFCKRVKGGTIDPAGLEAFRWNLSLSSNKSYSIHKDDLMKSEWESMRARISQERKVFAEDYCWQLKLLNDTTAVPCSFFSTEIRLSSEPGKIPEYAPRAFPVNTNVIRYIAGVYVDALRGSAQGFSCEFLDGDDRKKLLMEIISVGEVFAKLDEVSDKFNSRAAFGFDWPTIRIAREKRAEELLEQIQELR